MSDGEELNESTSPVEATPVEVTSGNKIKVDYGGKSREFDPEVFNNIADAYEKGQKWETTYHKKGEALNKQREALYSQEKEIKENLKILEEYKKIRKAFEANPAAYSAVQKALNEQESALPPAYKELEKKTHELEANMAYDKAVRDLAKEYTDFDEEGLRKFSLEYDVNNPHDMLNLYYHAWKGSQLSDLLEKAKAEVVLEAKKKPGLPPIGMKVTPKAEFPKTIKEQAELALRQIEQNGPAF
jgi:hypothetical protein